MASGDRVGKLGMARAPATTGAQLTQRDGGSTPVEQNQIYAFDASTIEYVDYTGTIEGYAGGGYRVKLSWSAATATSGVTRWGAAIRRIQDDAEDADTSHTYDYNDVDATAPSVSGELSYDQIDFSDGADADSLADGEKFILRIRRNASHANDTMTGDAELWPETVDLLEQ